MSTSVFTLWELKFSVGVQHQVTSLFLYRGEKSEGKRCLSDLFMEAAAAVEDSVTCVVNIELWVCRL